MSEDDATMTEWLADHPRMMGALFTLVLLLTGGTGSAVAGNVVTSGP